MDADQNRWIEAASRWTEQRTHEGEPARAICVTRVYDHPPAALWTAFVAPGALGRWYFPVSGDLREGGNYRLRHNAHGDILACEPERRLAVTWIYNAMTAWLTLTFEPVGGGTRLTLENIVRFEAESWTYYGPAVVGIGWDIAMRHLDVHLSGGPGMTADETSGWTRQDEGRAFCQLSADAWMLASRADGMEAETALAAGGMSLGFYTL